MDYVGHSYAIPPELNYDDSQQTDGSEEKFTEIVSLDKLALSKIKENRILYDFKTENYGKREITSIAWATVVKEIIKELRSLLTNHQPEEIDYFLASITVDSIKRRWRLLRQYFSSERLRRSKLVDGEVRGGFSLYDDMQFAARFIVEKKKRKLTSHGVLKPVAPERLKKPLLHTEKSSLSTTSSSLRDKYRVNYNNNEQAIKQEYSEIFPADSEVFRTDENFADLNDENNANCSNVHDDDSFQNRLKKDLKEAERLLQLEQKREATRHLKEKREKLLEEQKLKEKKTEVYRRRQEQANAQKLKRNEACANSVATMLSSCTSEEERKTLAFKVCEIIYN